MLTYDHRVSHQLVTRPVPPRKSTSLEILLDLLAPGPFFFFLMRQAGRLDGSYHAKAGAWSAFFKTNVPHVYYGDSAAAR